MDNNMDKNTTDNLNNDKHHFFIGNIFNNNEQYKLLRNLQKKIIKKYKLKYYHFNNKFCSNLIYLGYLREKTAYKYMNNIIKYLIIAITEKINVLNCIYTGFKIEYDQSYYKISLKINDENNYLENIIVPYLHNNGILPIYENKKNILKPSIDLIYYKSSNMEKNTKKFLNIILPTEKFKIDHISLIKGSSSHIRSGTPSTHNQMNLEEVYKFRFPFKPMEI